MRISKLLQPRLREERLGLIVTSLKLNQAIQTSKLVELQTYRVWMFVWHNLKLLETIVELKLPDYRLRQCSASKTCNEF